MSDFVQMDADDKLKKDLNRAETYEDLRALLENAVERSNLGVTRDTQTGRYVSRNPLSPAEQTLSAEEAETETFTRTEVIGGREITFKADSELALEKQLASAYKTAAEIRAPQPLTIPTVRRARTQAEVERENFDKAELDLQFRRGELTTAEYLERTNAVGEYLESKGFDVEAAARTQIEKSWQQATEEFLRGPGADWPGSERNKTILGNQLIAMGLEDATDKVGAMVAAYNKMKEDGLLFSPEPNAEAVIEATDNASPQEILEAWKAGQGDPETANANFIESHRQGRISSSSLFGK